MKKMKNKLLPLLLVAALLLTLAACGQTPPADTEPPVKTDTEGPGAEIAEKQDDTEKPDDSPKPEATAAPGESGGIYVKTDGEPDGVEREPGFAPATSDGAWYGGFSAAEEAMPGAMGALGSAGSAGDVTDGLEQYDPGEPFVLTAAEWNDNDNWPFFTNLVNAGTIFFPSFGMDPRNRVKVTAEGFWGAEAELTDADGRTLWTARTDRDGVAYLFWNEGETPAAVRILGTETAVTLRTEPGKGQQGSPVVTGAEDVEVFVDAMAVERSALQVMFIVDTTGSMSDELGYLQKDFSAIAGEFDGRGIEWSACFYRDEGDDYVTRVSEFSADTAAVQSVLEAEYAMGGGDTPEAVAQILSETLTMSFMQEDGRRGWQEDAEKLAFLIFDAPPHDGTDAVILEAVRQAAAAGIRVVPVVASNAERDTELFGRALAILTGGTYVFLTDDSGVGESHLEPIVGSYTVEKLHDVIVRIIEEHVF